MKNHIKFRITKFFVATLLCINAFGQEATIVSINPNPPCVGSAFQVAFNVSGSFGANNIFRVELSDSSGAFSPIPAYIGLLISTQPGSISCFVPITFSPGRNYKIRIRTSNPVSIGPVFTQNLTIKNPFDNFIDITQGLVMHLPFDGNAVDVSQNGNSGILTGNVRAISDRFGRPGKALDFNGTTSFVNVLNTPSLEATTNAISISGWFNADSTFNNGGLIPILAKSNISTNQGLYNIRFNKTNNQFQFSFRGRTTNVPAVIDLGKWYHFVATWQNDSSKFYLNGNYLGARLSVPSTFAANLPLEIGRYQPGGLSYFNGKLDDFRIYNRVLARTEIQRLYQAAPPYSNSPVCLGDSLRLIVPNFQTPGTTYLWNGPNNFSSNRNRVAIFASDTTLNGRYNVAIASDGCLFKDTLSVSIQRLTVLHARSNSPVGIGDSLKLFSSPRIAQTFWSGPNGYTSTLQNPFRLNTQAAFAGSYIVRGFNNGCPVVPDTVQVIVGRVLRVTSFNPVRLCPGANLNLNYSAFGAFSAGNRFILQISDSVGSFNNPINVDTLPGGNNGNAQILLPPGLPYGTQYRFRLVATSPYTEGLQSGLILSYYNYFPPVPSSLTFQGSLGDRSFFVSSDSVTWKEASRLATLAGGHLVTPNTLAKNQFLSTIVAGEQFWIGLSDDLQENVYRWINRATFAFNAWAPGEPANAPNKTGVVTNFSSQGNWGLLPNDMRRKFVVERNRGAHTQNANNCNGDTLRLTTPLFPGAAYLWTGPNGYSSTQARPSILNVNTDRAGTYNLVVTQFGCSSQPQPVVVQINTTTPPSIRDTSACLGSTVTLSAFGAEDGFYRWYTQALGGSPIAGQTNSTFTISNLAADTSFYVSAIFSSGCESSRSRVRVTALQINRIRIVSANGVNALCSGQQLVLKALDGFDQGSFQWYFNNSLLPDATSDSLLVTSVGAYKVVVAFAGCTDSSAVFNVVQRQTPDANAGQDVLACSSLPFSIGTTGQSGLVYRWIGSTQLNDTNQAVTGATITTSEPISFVFRLLVTDTLSGCFSLDTVSVVVNPNPTTFAGTDTTLCKNGTIQLGFEDETEGVNYNWLPSTNLDNPNRSNPVFSINHLESEPLNLVYVITKTNITSGCMAKDSVEIKIKAGFDTRFSGLRPTLCLNEPPALLVPATPGGIFSGTPALNNNLFSPSNTGNYQISYKLIQNGCLDSTTVNVSVESVESKFLSDTLFLEEDGNRSISVNATNVSSFIWRPGNLFTDSTASNPVWKTLNSSPIYVITNFQNSCSDTAFAYVLLQREEVSLPNVITMNGDGQNEKWIVTNLQAGSSVHISDRWGKKVFSTDTYQNNWPDKDIEAGTYFISLVTAKGKRYAQVLTILK